MYAQWQDSEYAEWQGSMYAQWQDSEYAEWQCREILSMLSDNARRMGPLRDKLQWVELWLKRRHLSSKLSRRVRAYYTEIWANHKGEAAFFLLPGSLL